MKAALQRESVGLGEAALAGFRSAVTGFSAEQLLWASGYLAGLATVGAAPAAPAQAADPRPRLTILYGSQTGNGRALATQLEAAAARRGVASELVSMADYATARLKREQLLAIIVSTHGEGDPPDDAMELHRFISGRRIPSLASLDYSVLALGDSSYENFCQTGRDFDARLEAAGARRLADLVECDLDYTAQAATWATRVLEEAEAQIGRHEAANVPQLRVVPAPPRAGRSAPFEAELLVNQRLTGRGSTKDVRHLELDIEGSGLTWEAGDSLGVVVRNPARIVEPLLEALALDGAAAVDAPDRTLRDELVTGREITTLNRPFLEAWAAAEPSGRLADTLAELRGAGFGQWMNSRQLIDIVREFPAEVASQRLLEMLRPLQSRLYSISSAPELAEEEIHLTVALVHYEAFGALHWGAGSSWLALDRDEGESLSVYVEPNPRFRLPADDAPMIMIGPGTGIAPFRAFMQARAARGATGKNWLVFGDRNFATDFLYQAEWLRYRKQGLLQRLDVAFSRDQAGKRYVQHRLLEESRELYRWLQDGAHLYVCGDASAMAPDVDRALREIIVRETNCDEDGVENYLAELRRAGRYQRDVY
ncbi:MAG TPA: assimilatory sulfite reductase (NADPH) flavoprotein subunit [Gammaproteobacteria bacterium]|nr:assimilatory sulfite reductase (NADPH) flavoprotein subunit [Gammaproteobacteria bacterium]